MQRLWRVACLIDGPVAVGIHLQEHLVERISVHVAGSGWRRGASRACKDGRLKKLPE